ncbi:MAG: HAMP domain-containing sensor histidine kinase [Synechococcus sp.]
MAATRPWREHLLGSLQGQLQLAIYLVVFLGFTGASSVGLWVGQRNLINNDLKTLRTSADAIESCLLKGGTQPDQVQQELLLHSTNKTRVWLEQADGTLILPQSDHLAMSEALIRASMQANPGRLVGQQRVMDQGNSRVISELVREFPSGERLWITHEINSNQAALSDYLALMIVIWGSCLTVTLLAVSWLVRRIVRPLEQLNSATTEVTADTLTSARLLVDQGPIEVVQLSRNYNALLERLAESWSQQRQFVSAVSHELRTPLTIVQGYLQRTIRRGDNLSDKQIAGLTTAADESVRMRRLLDDLLDLSRSDVGRLSLVEEPVVLADQLEQVVEMTRTTLQRPLELQLPNAPDERQVVVNADASRLRQVLLDLIENADNYSPPQAPIRLELQLEPRAAVIQVIDHGIGVPVADQERIFERFQRGSNAPEKTGSGLGLSIVKLLVEAMNGTIELSSQPNEGSCFSIRMPR